MTWLSDGQGRRLAFTAYPAREPWLHLLVSHGFGEHRGWYDHVARAFREEGISTYTFDHFHHGLSQGRPADVASYATLVEGLRLALEQGVAPLRPRGAPLALLGHSNGGLTALRAWRELPEDSLAAVVLSNPLLGLPWRFAVWGYAMARLIALAAPRLMLPLGTMPGRLTSNRSVWPDYGRDPLRFRSVSVRFFLEMAGMARRTRAETICPPSPLLVLSSGRDQVVDAAAGRAWFEALDHPAKRLVTYPELSHEVFNEFHWRGVVEDVTAWLRARVDDLGERPRA